MGNRPERFKTVRAMDLEDERLVWVYFVNPNISSEFLEDCIRKLENKCSLEKIGSTWHAKIKAIKELRKIDSGIDDDLKGYFAPLIKKLIATLKDLGIETVRYDVLLPNEWRDEILIMLRCKGGSLANENLMTIRYKREDTYADGTTDLWIYESHVALRKGEHIRFEEFGFPSQIRVEA